MKMYILKLTKNTERLLFILDDLNIQIRRNSFLETHIIFFFKDLPTYSVDDIAPSFILCE